MYQVSVAQKQERSNYTFEDTIYGEFNSAEEAIEFQRVVLQSFKDVTVKISFKNVETNVKAKEEEE